MPKGLPPCVSVASSLVPVGVSNWYQLKPKALVEKLGVLRRGYWSRLRGTGFFGSSQPVLKACFLVVSRRRSSGSQTEIGSRSDVCGSCRVMWKQTTTGRVAGSVSCEITWAG